MAFKLVTDSALNKAMNLLTGDRDMILNVYDPAAGRRQVAFSDDLPTAEEKAAWNDSDVFIATYGTTTYDEVDAAYKAGKEILCNWDNKIFRLSGYLNSGTPQYLFEMSGWSVSLMKDKWNDLVRTVHASTHASGGADPITPASIGAAEATHASTHASGGADPITPASIGAAEATHASTHASGGADPITPASIGAAPAYTYGTEDLTAGTSELATGKLYFVYE